MKVWLVTYSHEDSANHYCGVFQDRESAVNEIYMRVGKGKDKWTWQIFTDFDFFVSPGNQVMYTLSEETVR
jgi:hypothetical protein